MCGQRFADGFLFHPRIGKILKDEETVESYKIEEKGFVVCVVNKVCSATPRWRMLGTGAV